MQTDDSTKILDVTRIQLEKELQIGEHVHVTTKTGSYFYEKLPDGSLKETFVPRRQTTTHRGLLRGILERLKNIFI